MMTELAQQVSTMATTNNNIGNICRKQNTYIRFLPLTPAYCWLHGWRNHSRKEFTRKRPWHIDTATEDKLQGVNTRGLLYGGAGNNTISNRNKLTQFFY